MLDEEKNIMKNKTAKMLYDIETSNDSHKLSDEDISLFSEEVLTQAAKIAKMDNNIELANKFISLIKNDFNNDDEIKAKATIINPEQYNMPPLVTTKKYKPTSISSSNVVLPYEELDYDEIKNMQMFQKDPRFKRIMSEMEDSSFLINKAIKKTKQEANYKYNDFRIGDLQQNIPFTKNNHELDNMISKDENIYKIDDNITIIEESPRKK